MPRALHVAMLRNAALLVPAPERGEWLAEWKAELCYVNHDATAFCLGSFRDALWLRRKSFSVRRALSLDSPLRCVVFLAILAALTLLAVMPFRRAWLPAWSPPGAAQFALGCLWMYLLSLLVFVTLNPLGLGEYPANRHAPSLVIRLRRWIFLVTKIALVTPIPVFVSVTLIPVFPGAPSLMVFAWVFGFRWVLTDQKQRCPVCLRLLTNPARIGSPTQSILGWYGTELVCTRGHGLLYVPVAPTSWFSTQRWQYIDPTWSRLLP
ncbi:MAG: hypothetical protein WBG29_18580 [Candidatus Acidiferrales bacterium]